MFFPRFAVIIEIPQQFSTCFSILKIFCFENRNVLSYNIYHELLSEEYDLGIKAKILFRYLQSILIE